MGVAARRAFLAVTFATALTVGGVIVGVAATTPPPAASALQGPQTATTAQPAPATAAPDPAAVARGIDALGARANQLADAVVTLAQSGTTDTNTANRLYARLVAVARQLVRARRAVTGGGNGGGGD